MSLPTNRFLYLDNLRSFALLLGLIFHSAIVYAESVGYAIKSIERSIWFDHFCYFIHAFRMPLFFFLSGYFSEMVWKRKGWKVYLNTRSTRLVLPFVIGVLFLAPIQYYIVMLNKGGNFSFLDFYLQNWLRGFDGLSHLWFLQYLILYCIILVFFSYLKESLFFKKLPNWLLFLKYSFFTVCLTILTNLYLLKGTKYIHIDPYLFFFYMSFFIAGIFSYKNQIVFFGKTLSKMQLICLLFVCFVLFLLFESIEKSDPLWMSPFWGREWTRSYHILLASLVAWSLIYLFIEIFRITANWENKTSIYIRDSSLPIYLIHHPISLALAYILLPVEISVYAKFFIHTGLVFLFSFWIYDTLILPSPMIRKLMGMK
ncbi:MAG: acyltransferase family protein [Leptospira sp.]|nr:acyltransferase family protein [Leptospira sp.]